jgi:hypothetical protein
MKIDELPQVDSLTTRHCLGFGGRRSKCCSLGSPFSNSFDCRESTSAKTIGLLPRAPNPTTATDQCGSTLVGLLVALLCVETRPTSCQACNLDRLADRLAPWGVPVVLEVEVATGSTADTAGSPEPYCRDGSWDPDLGRREDRP